jgi:hypothetical protein
VSHVVGVHCVVVSVAAVDIVLAVVVSVVCKHDPVIDERVYRHGESNGCVLASVKCRMLLMRIVCRCQCRRS